MATPKNSKNDGKKVRIFEPIDGENDNGGGGNDNDNDNDNDNEDDNAEHPTLSPNSTLASLRQAVKQVEHEDYLDGQAAISEALNDIIEEHGIHDIVQATPYLDQDQTSTTASAASSISTTTKLSKPNRRASVNEDAKLLIDQMGGIPTIQPKPSESIAIENGANDLVKQMDSSDNQQKNKDSTASSMKSSKPVNARYLSLLEKQKRQQNQSNNRSISGHQNNSSTTTLSDISRILNNSTDQLWYEKFKEKKFKSYNEEMLFCHMQQVRQLNKEKKGRKPSSTTTVSSLELNEQTTREKQQQFAQTWSQLGRQSHSRGHGHGHDDEDEGNENRYMRFDDNKNCTFRPKTNESKKGHNSSGNGNGNGEDDNENENKNSRFENFIARQEAKERSRRQDNEFTKGKEDYERYQLNKKYCPRCNGKQSYDEVKEKRKNCPNCHVAYRPKTCWGDIGSGFYERQNKYSKKYKEHSEEIRKRYENESDEEEEEEEKVSEEGKSPNKNKCRCKSKSCSCGKNKCKKRSDPFRSRSVPRRDGLKWTKELEEEFLLRQADYQTTIHQKLLNVEREMYGGILVKGVENEKEEEEEEVYVDGYGFEYRDRDVIVTTRDVVKKNLDITWTSSDNKGGLGRSASAGRVRNNQTYPAPPRSSHSPHSHPPRSSHSHPHSSRSSLREGSDGSESRERERGMGGSYHTRQSKRDNNEYLFHYRRK